jgi:hypothetical protein
MIDKEKTILVLLNQTIEESIKLDLRNRIEKARKGEFDEGGDKRFLRNRRLYISL